ncbi:MAG: recombinase RecT [Ignavibacteria bacterium]|nr:recombinase RecT [Ignavibacteria bacterium]
MTEHKASNPLVVIKKNLHSLLKDKAEALPRGFNETRFIQNALVVLQKTPKIQKMEPWSVALTLLKGAFLDLDFAMKECYAIPYGNELVFQTDYKGEVKLAKKYSIRPVKDIYAKVAQEGDVFDLIIEHGRPSFTFHPKPFNDGQIIGAFAVCQFEDYGMIYETMSKKDIENIRYKFSKYPKSKAWVEVFGEMCKKTVIRRLRKHITLEFENPEQIEADEIGSGVEFKEEPEDAIMMPEAIDEEEHQEEQPSKREQLIIEFKTLIDKAWQNLDGFRKGKLKNWKPEEHIDEEIEKWIDDFKKVLEK